MNMRDVLAVILGGGVGTRLFPLTRDRTKPAVPLAGKYRLIDIPMSNCFHAGIEKIAILTQFNSVSLHRHIHRTYTRDIFTKGWVQILAAEQTHRSGDWYQGTADAIYQNLWYIKRYRPKNVLILSGDQLYRMPFDGGRGGTPVPVEGASKNGMSNTFPKVSPDGKWIAYASGSSGAVQTYLAPWPEMTPVTQVSTTSGTWCFWTETSDRLLFQQMDGRVMEVSLTEIDGEARPRNRADDLDVGIEEFAGAQRNPTPWRVAEVHVQFAAEIQPIDVRVSVGATTKLTVLTVEMPESLVPRRVFV